MKPKQRYEWLKQQIAANSSADVMDMKFVDSYIVATDAPYTPQMFGANTCRQLGRDLSAMYKAGMLTRGRVGLTEHYTGMPNWVYVYRVKDQN